MRKLFLLLASTIAAVACVVACLNPIGFNPDDNINISGKFEVEDVTSAVLMLVNRSKTIDVMQVEITQPEQLEQDIEGNLTEFYFTKKPLRLTRKAQYVPPSDIDYQVKIFYKDFKDNPTKTLAQALEENPDLEPDGSRVISIPVPLPKQIVEIYIYRTKDGVVVVDKEVEDPDETDTGNPEPLDPHDPEDGNGSVPGIVPPHNRDTMGVFVVVNMTKNQPIDQVTFQTGGAMHSIGLDGSSVPAIRARDQQSIALRQGTYSTVIKYKEGSDSKTLGPKNSVVVSYNSPQALNNYLYFYKTQSGDCAVDNQWPPKNKDQSEDDNMNIGEGSVPGVIPEHNRDKMGVFVVMNMTKAQPIDKVNFGMDKKSFAIESHGTVKAVAARDQQSIALGEGSWETVVEYTTGGEKKQVGPKQSIVIPMNDPQALYNYLYFYKTKSGGFDISNRWPPAAGNNADEENVGPEDILDDTHGILEITNKSETGSVLKGIMIDTIEHTVTMVKEDVLQFVLPVGTVDVSFKPQNQAYYGLIIPREIKARQITKLAYYDNLSNMDDIPPNLNNPALGSGLIKITNNSTGIVVYTMIVDKDDPSNNSMGIHYSLFVPNIPINYAKVGRVPVIGTDDFPLETAKIYLVQISVETPQGIVTIERYAVIRDQIVNVTITENDLKPEKLHGSTVKLVNLTQTPSRIIGMSVYNVEQPMSRSAYDKNSWNPGEDIKNGSTEAADNSATVKVVSSTGLPIYEGATYKADIIVSGNGNTGVIRGKVLGSLYDRPDVVRVVITQQDITCGCPGGGCPGGCDGNCTEDNCNCPPLVENFVPIQGTNGISGIPSELSSYISYTPPSPASSFGSVNLNSVAVVSPANASKRSPIEWSLTGGTGMGLVTITNGELRAKDTIALADHDKTVEIKATIRDAAGTVVAKQDYTQTFTIRLKVYSLGIEPHPVTSISASSYPLTILKDDSPSSLLSTVQFTPTYPSINGVPITVDDLEWTIVSGGTGTATLSGTNSRMIKGTALGIVHVKATLPAAKNNGTSVSTTSPIIVTVIENFVPITANGISGIPSELRSYISFTPPSPASSFGSVNLNSVAVVSPANASKRSPIEWAISGGTGSSLVTITGGVLEARNTIALTDNNKTVQIQATIRDAAGTVNAKQDYTQTFTVTLKVDSLGIEPHPVTSISASSSSMKIKLSDAAKSLLSTVQFTPSSPSVNGIPITLDDLEWTIISGGTGTGTLSGTNNKLIKGTAVGAVHVRATLPAAKNNGTSVSTTSPIIVTVEDDPPPPFTAVTDIVGVPATLQSSISYSPPNPNHVFGTVDLNNVSLVLPTDADKRSPITWAIISGDGSTLVNLSNGVLSAKNTITTTDNNKVVNVRATIAQGAGTSTAKQDYTKTFAITLKVVSTGIPTNPVTNLSLSGSSLTVQETQTASLRNGVQFNPANPMHNNVPITLDDLTWAIMSGGTGQASLSGSNITGVKQGTVNVRVTLPAEKNGNGGAKTLDIVVTVTERPHPSYIPLRIIQQNADDSIASVMLVKRSLVERPEWRDKLDACTPVAATAAGTHRANPRPSVLLTGHTGTAWATVTAKANLTEFKKLYPVHRQIDVGIKGKDKFKTLTELDWPTDPDDGFLVFFVEGDKKTRGYCNPGALDPAIQYAFYINPKALLDNGRLIWMIDNKEVAEGTPGAELVLPIGYHTYYNTASVMKSQGVGKVPLHDAN